MAQYFYQWKTKINHSKMDAVHIDTKRRQINIDTYITFDFISN